MWWNIIIKIIDAASSRLSQAKSNDLFIVLDCLKLCTRKLPELQTEDQFAKFVQKAEELWITLGFDADKADLKSIPVRGIKKMDDDQ